jgi:hypothetical protein
MSKIKPKALNAWISNNYDQASLKLPKGMWERFRVVCEGNGTNRRQVLLTYIKEYIGDDDDNADA